jgi:glycine oxidase
MKTFDVAIAGGGLIGASIALELARAGLRVGVFDRGEPGREASWASAGILSPAPENPGAIPMVPLGKASLALYPEFVAMVEEISGQSVGFRLKGTLEALFSGDAVRDLSTLIALHHGLGLKAEPLRPEDARELEPALSPDVEAAALRPEEASVDNRLLTDAVLHAAQSSNVEILPGQAVQGIWREGGRCAGLRLAAERVSAKWTIVAAGCFCSQIEGMQTYAPVRPAKGQIIALRHDGLQIERVLWSEKIYLVPRSDGRIIAGARPSTWVSTGTLRPADWRRFWQRRSNWRRDLRRRGSRRPGRDSGRILPTICRFSGQPTSRGYCWLRGTFAAGCCLPRSRRG